MTSPTTPEEQIPMLFMVVCTQYHHAYGVFTSPEQALAFAKDKTATSACDYVPIPMRIAHGELTNNPTPPTTTTHRGYL